VEKAAEELRAQWIQDNEQLSSSKEAAGKLSEHVWATRQAVLASLRSLRQHFGGCIHISLNAPNRAATMKTQTRPYVGLGGQFIPSHLLNQRHKSCLAPPFYQLCCEVLLLLPLASRTQKNLVMIFTETGIQTFQKLCFLGSES
jgi:hypothetical protein